MKNSHAFLISETRLPVDVSRRRTKAKMQVVIKITL